MKQYQRIGYRFEVCEICGREWNVSRKLRLPREGYICPGCDGRAKTERNRGGNHASNDKKRELR